MKIVLPQLLERFSAFCITRSFVTAFSTAPPTGPYPQTLEFSCHVSALYFAKCGYREELLPQTQPPSGRSTLHRLSATTSSDAFHIWISCSPSAIWRSGDNGFTKHTLSFVYFLPTLILKRWKSNSCFIQEHSPSTCTIKSIYYSRKTPVLLLKYIKFR